jgi:hypothetical protein
MIAPKHQPHSSLTSRSHFITLLDSAIYAGSLRYARQITLTWLAYFPGDLPVRLKYGRILLNSGQIDQAIQHLNELCQSDPEYLDAWILLAEAIQGRTSSAASSEQAFAIADCQSAIHALGGNVIASAPLPSWADNILLCRQALAQNDIEASEEYLHEVLVVDPMPPLMAVTHLEIMKASELPSIAIQNLSDFYHQRFPTAIHPILSLADSLMDSGEPERAVALLHQGATLDVTGQVAQRVWGFDYPYRNLWPENLEAPIDIPIPSDVAALFGWNRLPQQASQSVFVPKYSGTDQGTYRNRMDLPRNPGEGILTPAVIQLGEPSQRIPSAVKAGILNPNREAIPESLCSIQAELDEVAGKLNKRPLAQKDGRFPIYVIFSTRSGLENYYGYDQFERINEEMEKVTKSVSSRQDWGAVLVYADDPDCMAKFDLNPVSPEDPWSLKLVLADLDEYYGRKGEMIGALLIVGGPEIVPYHNLPNPVDDIDLEVPSDNPYATRDENYFVPEWPVGRLPGGHQKDASLLLNSLQQIAHQHANLIQRKNWFQRWWEGLWIRRIFSSNGKKSSWGYTAAIWRRASLTVFRPIGAPHTMFVSPPVQAENGTENNNGSLFPSARLGYFNLHGLQDSSNWYGQRDPSEPTDLPDYPVALRPQDVINDGHSPKVVFSEACYGAHIQGKEVDGALALKFLDSGSQTVVGSTCTSYGSISTPLIAADLLGHAFWKFLQEDIPAGEALRRAKIYLAKEMHHRQGYLDGEDQKTLISFLLLGDPLAQLSGSAVQSNAIMRSKRSPTFVKTVCDRYGNCQVDAENTPHPLNENPPVPSKTLAQVKIIVEEYLPGMRDANVQYARSHATCSGEGHSCPTSLNGAKTTSSNIPENNVVTLSKQVEKSNSLSGKVQTHYHYARVTIDDKGKIIKLTVSR